MMRELGAVQDRLAEIADKLVKAWEQDDLDAFNEVIGQLAPSNLDVVLRKYAARALGRRGGA